MSRSVLKLVRHKMKTTPKKPRRKKIVTPTVTYEDDDGACHCCVEEERVGMNPLIRGVRDCLRDASHAYGASLRVHAATFGSLMPSSSAALANAIIVRVSNMRMASPGFGPDVSSNHHNSPTPSTAQEHDATTTLAPPPTTD